MRDIDSEAKILNNIAARLGNRTSTTGTITLFTERPPRTNSSNVIDVFRARYTNINLIVINNNGAVIPPKP